MAVRHHGTRYWEKFQWDRNPKDGSGVCMNQVVPRRPSRISEYTMSCLNAIALKGLGDRLSIGGAFGLMHYVDYRETHDVDAWWLDSTTSEEEHEIVRTLEEALKTFGEVGVRRWGDVVSVELHGGARGARRAEAAQVRAWFKTEFLGALR